MYSRGLVHQPDGMRQMSIQKMPSSIDGCQTASLRRPWNRPPLAFAMLLSTFACSEFGEWLVSVVFCAAVLLHGVVRSSAVWTSFFRDALWHVRQYGTVVRRFSRSSMRSNRGKAVNILTVSVTHTCNSLSACSQQSMNLDKRKSD